MNKKGVDLQLLKDLEHISIEFGTTISHRIHLLGKTAVKSLRDLFRLADTATLDDDVVVLLQFGKADQLFEQVTPESTTDTSVL